MNQKNNPNENLTFNTPLEPSDAIADIGQIMGLDDAGVIEKIPWLGEFNENEKVVFEDDGDGDIIIRDEASEGHAFWTKLENKDGKIEVINQVWYEDDPIYPPNENGFPDVPMHD